MIIKKNGHSKISRTFEEFSQEIQAVFSVHDILDSREWDAFCDFSVDFGSETHPERKIIRFTAIIAEKNVQNGEEFVEWLFKENFFIFFLEILRFYNYLSENFLNFKAFPLKTTIKTFLSKADFKDFSVCIVYKSAIFL